MSNYLVKNSHIAALANAIRARTGVIGSLEFPSGFVSAVNLLADSSDATATAGDIRSGKTAYANRQKITGSSVGKSADIYLPDYGASAVPVYSIAAGKHLTGDQTIKGLYYQTASAALIASASTSVSSTTKPVGVYLDVNRAPTGFWIMDIPYYCALYNKYATFHALGGTTGNLYSVNGGAPAAGDIPFAVQISCSTSMSVVTGDEIGRMEIGYYSAYPCEWNDPQEVTCAVSVSMSAKPSDATNAALRTGLIDYVNALDPGAYVDFAALAQVVDNAAVAQGDSSRTTSIRAMAGSDIYTESFYLRPRQKGKLTNGGISVGYPS